MSRASAARSVTFPAYLAHRFSPALVVFDVEKGEPARNEQGFCIRCAPNEPGEALSKVVDDSSNIGSRFEGYTNQEASEKQILRDVFEPGDAWVRTGDLMRKDEQGYFYFVDRIGDTFRWKGENVATSEVAEAICAFPGVKHANVYGVSGSRDRRPSRHGDAGRPKTIWTWPASQPPDQPLAVAMRGLCFCAFATNMDLTGTFKYSKTELVRQGFDPAASNDAVYFDDPEAGAFARLDQALYERIQAGRFAFSFCSRGEEVPHGHR